MLFKGLTANAYNTAVNGYALEFLQQAAEPITADISAKYGYLNIQELIDEYNYTGICVIECERVLYIALLVWVDGGFYIDIDELSSDEATKSALLTLVK